MNLYLQFDQRCAIVGVAETHFVLFLIGRFIASDLSALTAGFNTNQNGIVSKIRSGPPRIREGIKTPSHGKSPLGGYPSPPSLNRQDFSVKLTKTSQELRMLSSITLDCQVTKIVMNSGSQL